MTAPAVPEVKVKQFGDKLRLAWREVPNATDYNVYVGDTLTSMGIEDTVNWTAVLTNGWFIWWSRVTPPALTFLKVTALNVGAEESSGTVRQLWINSGVDVIPVNAADDIPQATDIYRRLS